MPWKERVKANIITWLALLVIGAAGGFILFEGPTQVRLYARLPDRVAAIEDGMNRLDRLCGLIHQLNEQAFHIRISQLTMTGRADVGYFGREEAYLMVNTLANSAVYTEMDRMRVTNMNHPDTPTLDMDVRGTFSNRDDTLLIRLSENAAVRLDIRESSRVRIRPVEGLDLQPLGILGPDARQ